MSDLKVNDLVRIKSVRPDMDLAPGNIVRLVVKGPIGSASEQNWQIQSLLKSKPERLYLKESRLEKI